MKSFKNPNLSPQERARLLLPLLSTKEKVGQVNQRLYGFSCYTVDDGKVNLTDEFKNEVKKFNGLGVLYGLYRADPWSNKNYDTGLKDDLAIKAYNKVQKFALENSRFGIPALMSSECPHGHQALDGYLLPVNLALGATWNPDLVSDSYKVCAKQMKEMGVDLALISMLDVLRDPRWGRSEECYSEDPYLSARFAKSVTEGCQSEGVSVVAKHFAAQGETTGGVNASAARIGERELREIHFPPMKACCDANVTGVMAAYNEIDGVLCHGNSWLLNRVLRDEMGFSGVVMADGTAIDRLDVVTGDNTVSGALALKSGVDISLWDTGFSNLEEAIKKGHISEKVLDSAVLRVLELKFKRGLFENPYKKEKGLTNFSYSKYTESLELARESVILLKNENHGKANSNILPLNKDTTKNIAIIGPYANDIYAQLGDYTPPVKDDSGYTLVNGMKTFSPESAKINYVSGCSTKSDSAKLTKQAVDLAKKSDVIILALGGTSSRFAKTEFDINGAVISSEGSLDCGEGADKATLELSKEQQILASDILALNKPVITIINGGRPYIVECIKDKTSALIYSFYPGPMGGKALAEILWGDVSPSGHLPVSLPKSAAQLPVYYNHKSSYKPMDYVDLENTPSYPFGFGLSYSNIDLSNITISSKSMTMKDLETGSFKITGNVKNTGDFDAKSVIQLFIRAKSGEITPRIKELKDFVKISINAKDKKSFSLSLDKNALARLSKDMQFKLHKGKIDVSIEEGGKLFWNEEIEIP